MVLARLFGAILMLALLAVMFKIAIILSVIVGLIFRTKETIALLIMGGLITLLSRHPMIGLAVIGVGLIAVITVGTRRRDSEDPPPSLTERSEE